MQADRFHQARIWLANAHQNLEVAEQTIERWANVACFHAQQASEKALKGALVALTSDVARTHVAHELVNELADLGESVPPEISRAAASLDRYYTGTRYPEALGGANPMTVYDAGDAERALDDARKVYGFADGIITRCAEFCS